MTVPRLKTCETYSRICTREAVWRVRSHENDAPAVETDPWTYDAPQYHPLTALRIPVTGAYPDFRYLVAFDRASAMLPSQAELRMLVSYLDKVRSYFNDTWQAQMLSRPFDTDGGQNTIIFHKRGPGDWAYRRISWTGGPEFVPVSGPVFLEALLDQVTHNRPDDPNPIWVKWKRDHADAFLPTTDETPIMVPEPHDPWTYACVLHLNQVATYLLDGERGRLDVEHLVCNEGSRDTLRRYREDAL